MTLYSKNIFLPILSLLLLLILLSGEEVYAHKDYGKLYATLRAEQDSIDKATRTDSISSGLLTEKDSIQFSADSITVELGDSITADSVSAKEKKDVLDAPVAYQAEDSLVWIMATSKAYLYKNSQVDYQNIGLTAEQIMVDIDTKTVYAHGVTDSTGAEFGRPVFKDGETPYESDTMSYNFGSRKGYISNVVTQQGEGYITSNDAKKGTENEFFLGPSKYTTCDQHENPHFYMALTRAKVRPGKNIVFGPAYLVVEDVPLPLAIPFGFFPFSNDTYASGFIMPTYGDETERGFYLRDGGYYFAISDYMDLKLTGEIFTKGSWGLNASNSYNKRYKFSGAVNISTLTTKLGEKNMPDYSVSKDFKIQWTHRQDAKASPNSTFSASVNYATSSYERSNLSSQYNLALSSQSTRTSSVSYSRTFPNIGLTLSGTFNIAQNVRDSSLAVSFPDLNISLSRLYPFKRKKRLGKEQWYGMLPYHVDALDAALLAEQYERPVDEIATLYFDAYHVLQLDWMMDNIATLPQQDYWDRRARHALMNELSRSLRLLMDAILSKPDAKQAFGEWRSRHLDHLESVTTEMSKLDNLHSNDENGQIGLSTLSVLMSELSGLVTK